MKSKIIILTPVYNDWKNLEKLLKKINKIFEKNLKKVFELIIVNDCSKENFDFEKYKLKMIKKIKIISLDQNIGSQRAIAIGIKYINHIYKNKKFKTIIIDSDGQDNPKIIPKMLFLSEKKPKFSIAVNRGQRKEELWFRFFYEIYCFIIKKRYIYNHSLKVLIKEFINIDISKQFQISDFGGELSTAQLKYCANDVIYLHKIHEELYKILEREKRVKLYEDCLKFLKTRVDLDLALFKDDIWSH